MEARTAITAAIETTTPFVASVASMLVCALALGLGSGCGDDDQGRDDTAGTTDTTTDATTDITAGTTPETTEDTTEDTGNGTTDTGTDTEAGTGGDMTDTGATDTTTVGEPSDTDETGETGSSGADTTDTDTTGGEPFDLSGAVQKGPFVLGSTVTVSPLNTRASTTGASYDTQTLSDRGEFSVELPAPGPVLVEGSGYYYNEVTGELSKATLTLRAVGLAEPGMPICVNAFTHLASDRIRALVKAGTAWETAIAQTEGELTTALQLGGQAFTLAGPGAGLNLLGGDTDGNAYLFLLSTLLTALAVEDAGATGSVEAKLQELLNTAAASFATAGTLDAAFVNRLRDKQSPQSGLLPERIIEKLAARIAAIGSTATPPNLARVWDTDHDGFVDALDTCALVANPGQAPLNDLCRRTYGPPRAVDSTAYGRVLADMDGDNILDAIRTGTTAVQFFKGDGKGGFGDAVGSDYGPDGLITPDGGQSTLATGDFDFDGTPDVVLACGRNTDGFVETCVLPASTGEPGRFAVPERLSLRLAVGVGTASGFDRFAAGDFNRDGIDDLAGSYGPGANMAASISRNPTTDVVPLLTAPATAPPLTLAITSVAAGDVNNDGLPDLLVTSTDEAGGGVSGGLLVLLGVGLDPGSASGAGYFVPQPLITVAGTRLYGATVATIDPEAPFPTIIVQGRTGNNTAELRALDADETGRYATDSLIPGLFATDTVAVGDVTGDGYGDLVFTYGGDVQILAGGPAGTGFTALAPFRVPGEQNIAALLAGDLNGDGHTDAVVETVSYGPFGERRLLTPILLNSQD